MKRKLSLLLAMVLAMTMVLGVGLTAFAGEPYPERVSKCEHGGTGLAYVYYINTGESRAYVAFYSAYTGEGLGTTYAEPFDAFYEEPVYGNTYHMSSSDMLWHICEPSVVPPAGPCGAPAHVHNFQWQTITEPTQYSDGLEGEVCSCGAVRNTQPLSAYGYALNEYATPMINAAKSGQTITFEFGEWNSFPKAFMEKVAAKSAQNVTFVFKYKWNHVKQEITIPAGTVVDTSLDWYGPAKMAELYGAN